MTTKDAVIEPFDVLGAGAGGPLPPSSPWTQYGGYLGYQGGVVVGTGANMGPGLLNVQGLYIGGVQFDNTTVVLKAGSTLTGPLVLAADPTAALGAATKQYVDNKVATAGAGTFLPLTGGTLTGALTLNADPAAPLGASTKNYVDTRTPITADAPANGQYYTRYNNTWQPAPSGITIPDAPTDGNTYHRLNGAWTSAVDGNVGTNALKIIRSGTAGSRPTGRTYGEPYVNFGDNQFGVVNSSGAAVDLISSPIFSTLASYATGVTVNNGGRPFLAKVSVAPGAFNGTQWSILISQYEADARYLSLAGGTLTGPLILQADPTAALGAATKQYVDNAPKGSAPQCGYFQIGNSTQCNFVQYMGANIRIAGIDRNIPSSCYVTTTNMYVEGVAGQNLAANTLYYVYAFWTGSTVVLNCSQTAYGFDAAAGNVGVAVKGNDNTQSLVGMVRTNASAQFQDSGSNRWVASWFNRRWKTVVAGLGNNSTGSSAATPVGNPIYAICWASDEVQVWLNAQMGTTGSFCQASIGMDGGNNFGNSLNFSSDYYAAAMAAIGSASVLSDGYHYWYAFIATNGGTMTFNNGNLFARFRS